MYRASFRTEFPFGGVCASNGGTNVAESPARDFPSGVVALRGSGMRAGRALAANPGRHHRHGHRYIGRRLADTMVTLVGDQTDLTRTQKTNSSGSYEFVNLPIGTYTLTFGHDGFETQKIPSILVQADRTVSLNPALKVGQVGTTITVEESPLLNAVDTTNGYVLDKAELEAIPLPTGSFTGLAILSPGVSAELPAGTGANAGLGNQPIWANGSAT